MNENQKYFDYVVRRLNKRTILEQLAEEASELTKASLKLIRSENFSNNFTPITKEESIKNLNEEIDDIRMIILVLRTRYDELQSIPNDSDILNNPKWERWAKRLGYVE